MELNRGPLEEKIINPKRMHGLIWNFSSFPNYKKQRILWSLEFQGPYGPLRNSSPCGGLARFAHKISAPCMLRVRTHRPPVFLKDIAAVIAPVQKLKNKSKTKESKSLIIWLFSRLCIWKKSSLLFLMHCGISTKQEMELLSCDLTSCYLCQSFTDLQWSRT